MHLCGHVHGKWKHLLDPASQCLNVNVGVDAWGFRMLSEDELVRYARLVVVGLKKKLVPKRD